MIIDLKFIKIRYQFGLKLSGGTQSLIDVNNTSIWLSYNSRYASFFRLFGRGLRWKHEKLGLLFSERNGYRKYIKIGRWIIGYLPYNKD